MRRRLGEVRTVALVRLEALLSLALLASLLVLVVSVVDIPHSNLETGVGSVLALGRA